MKPCIRPRDIAEDGLIMGSIANNIAANEHRLISGASADDDGAGRRNDERLVGRLARSFDGSSGDDDGLMGGWTDGTRGDENGLMD